MHQPQTAAVTIRVATKDDAPVAGKICFEAFQAISNAHNFPPDLPAPEAPRISTARSPTFTADAWMLGLGPSIMAPAAGPQSVRLPPWARRRG